MPPPFHILYYLTLHHSVDAGCEHSRPETDLCAVRGLDFILGTQESHLWLRMVVGWRRRRAQKGQGQRLDCWELGKWAGGLGMAPSTRDLADSQDVWGWENVRNDSRVSGSEFETSTFVINFWKQTHKSGWAFSQLLVEELLSHFGFSHTLLPFCIRACPRHPDILPHPGIFLHPGVLLKTLQGGSGLVKASGWSACLPHMPLATCPPPASMPCLPISLSSFSFALKNQTFIPFRPWVRKIK